ncbi:hypothetical protein EIN_252610 [Entamoeba invadens IP1]|uniref:Uncharacterized protein n=1 Tax=Entamoeba invadens IP1 TaxID=370355 RepID=A0A0A1UHB4_ENTIV|nr:hypothetical protein EIN_252610 [Entamoeba invadens IP1]ELP95027.1 hypothetical protein EIN_252610 [Entamoeba invadens IP1]|eukprot:XP_004261798.1 hypothetical protein EIN_252610 [Entamoeba invadens IP1]
MSGLYPGFVSSLFYPLLTLREQESDNFKVVFTGDPMVGKTSLIYRMVSNEFKETLPPTVPDVTPYQVKENNKTYNFQINDTAGQEIYRTVTSSYYRGCSGIFLVYSQNDESSFKSLSSFYSDIVTYTQEKKPLIVILANKSDLEETVKLEEARKFAKEMMSKDKIKITVAQVSAKTGEGVTEALKTMVTDLMNGNIYPQKVKKSGPCVLL